VNGNGIEMAQYFADIILAASQPAEVVEGAVYKRCRHPDYQDIEPQPPALGFGFENDQEGDEEDDQVTEVRGSPGKPGRATMPEYRSEMEWVEGGPEYEFDDLGSLRHCCKGVASLMHDYGDKRVNGKRQKPAKVLLDYFSTYHTDYDCDQDSVSSVSPIPFSFKLPAGMV